MNSPADRFAEAVRVHQSGDLLQAERLYREFLQTDRTNADALSNLGAVLVHRGQFDEAVACHRAALQSNPRHPAAIFNLGNAYRRMGRLEAALECYRAFAGVPNPPAGLNYTLGLTLMGLGRLNEAEAAFRAAPNDPRSLHHLGLVLARQGRPEEAIAALEQALQRRPNYPEALNTLGVVLDDAGQSSRAFTCYRQALALRPDLPDANNNIANALTEQGLIEEAVGHFRRSLAVAPNQPHVHSNMLLTLHYSPNFTPQVLWEEHRRWAERFAPVTSRSPDPHDPRHDRKLRIGYVSGDFRIHPVAAFIEPVLAHLDRAAFHVSCFSNIMRADAVTQRLQGLADSWHSITGVPDEAVEQLIRREAIDILVDLSGHTAGNRLLVFARRPAPVQVTQFGYPDTTGLAAIDFRITDGHADPPGASEARYSERLVRLPEVAWCYRPPDDAPDFSESSIDAEKPITLISLNNPAKLTAEVIAAWAQILDAIPGSRLIALAGRQGSASRRVEELCSKNGIGGERLQLMPRLPAAEYLTVLGSADLALDPWPYNGGVTTCDALWMGLPVVTMAGPTYVSRQGVSLLAAVGLSDLAATSTDEYVEIAKRWAENRDHLNVVRSELRLRMQASALADAARFTRHLETAYQSMWRWRVGAGPAP